MAEHEPALELDRVSAGYGETVVLEEVSLSLREGESVSLIGRNGVGKTTLLATVMGHTSNTQPNQVPQKHHQLPAGMGRVAQWGHDRNLEQSV